MQVDVVTHLFNTVVSSSNFIKFIEEIKKNMEIEWSPCLWLFLFSVRRGLRFGLTLVEVAGVG